MDDDTSFFQENEEFWEQQAKPYLENQGIKLIKPDEVSFDIGDLHSIDFPVTYFEVSTKHGSMDDDQVKDFIDLLNRWGVTELLYGFATNEAALVELLGSKPAQEYGKFFHILRYCYFVKDGGLYCLAFRTTQEEETEKPIKKAKK